MYSKRNGEDTPIHERWNRVFRVLSAEPRRELVSSLLDSRPDEPVSLPAAAKSEHYRDTSRALRIELRHRHLPALADAGYVRWRSAPFEAYRGPEFAEVASVFEAMRTAASAYPDRLVVGCEPLEQRR
jgi:hypothetical protein